MPWNLIVVTPYMMYERCAVNREYKDLIAETGWGYSAYLDYTFYAEKRWALREA
jgi:hypothetical protein